MSSAIPLSPNPNAETGPPATPPDASAGVKRSRRESRQHRCAYCPKVFKRSEHCIRHERSHTNEKPYSCQYCHKCYARKDLVTRHERTLHADAAAITVGGHLGEESQSEDTSSEPEDEHPSNAQNRSPRRQSLFSPEKRRKKSPLPTTRDAGSITVATDTETIATIGLDLAEGNESVPHGVPSLSEPRTEQQTDPRPLGSMGIATEDIAASFLDTSFPYPIPPSVLPLPDGTLDFSQDLGFLNSPSWLAFGLPDDHHSMYDVQLNNCLDTATRTAVNEVSPNSTACDSDLSMAEPEQVSTAMGQQTSCCSPYGKKASAALIDKAAYASICDELSSQAAKSRGSKDLPTLKTCQNFLASYMGSFHCHLPILHLQSLALGKVPNALILAMCSIGALYRLDRRRARRLYDLARILVEPVVIKDFPLWFTQTRFLLTFYATFSGDQDLVSTSTDESGFYNLIYNQARNKLNSNKAKISTMEWSRWVERESWKRVLGGIYVAGTLRMVIYGINPIFNASNDLEVECFHEETLWNAQSSSEWLSLRPKHEHQEVGTMRDLVEGVLSDDQKRSRLDIARVSHFSLLILTHAVMVHMRQLYQISQTSALCAFSNQSFLGQSLLKTGLESLSRCYNLLQMPHQDRLEDLDDKEIVSLRFSSYGILRAAYIRLFDITTGFDRLTLMAEDPKVIETSVAILAEAPLERDRFLLDAVEKTLEGFQIPFRMGHMLMRKTAAFRWSIEHAVAAWDAGLFVTKWVHSVEIDAINGIEPTRAETDLLTAMKEVLEEADYDTEENRSFSAGLARTWSLFLQDVWVWGITVRMGKVLEHLATAYENHNEAQRQK